MATRLRAFPSRRSLRPLSRPTSNSHPAKRRTQQPPTSRRLFTSNQRLSLPTATAAATKTTNSNPSDPQPQPQQPTTIDATEIKHFNALASTWWDPHGPSRLLHLMNPHRHTFIRSCLHSQRQAPNPSQKYEYLDIGCGGGIFAESAARLSTTKSVTAIDPSSSVIQIAEAHKRRDPLLMREGRLTYLNHGIEHHHLHHQQQQQQHDELPSSQSSSKKPTYDIITIFEVLEHVSSPSTFLTHILPFTKPGGWIILSTIARTYASWAITNVIAEDILGIVPRGTHDWNKYINEVELREWFGKQDGWGSPRAMGVVYVPGIGWREVAGAEKVGNYFWGIRRDG